MPENTPEKPYTGRHRSDESSDGRVGEGGEARHRIGPPVLIENGREVPLDLTGYGHSLGLEISETRHTTSDEEAEWWEQ